MTLQAIIQRDVDTATPGETAQAAAGRMRSRNVGMLVVVDSRSHPIGVLTDRDLALSVVASGSDPHQVQVMEVMTPDPTCLAEDRNTDEALAVMQRRGVRRLPVVNARGLLVGVVSMDDVLQTAAARLAAVSRVIDTSSPRRLALSEEEPVVLRTKKVPAKAAKKRATRKRAVRT
jgi:CBS domain-containing protein